MNALLFGIMDITECDFVKKVNDMLFILKVNAVIKKRNLLL